MSMVLSESASQNPQLDGPKLERCKLFGFSHPMKVSPYVSSTRCCCERVSCRTSKVSLVSLKGVT